MSQPILIQQPKPTIAQQAPTLLMYAGGVVATIALVMLGIRKVR